MKKIVAIILTLVLCLSMIGCGTKTDNEAVEKACELIGEKWVEIYNESPFEVGNDRYLEIKNTRIVHIKDTGLEELKDVDYVIDFLILTNYTGTAPYYTVSDFYNTVTVFKDGTIDCETDVFAIFTGAYGNDFKRLVDSVDDCGAEFNRVIKVEK